MSKPEAGTRGHLSHQWNKIHISLPSFILSIWLLNRQCLLAGTAPVWYEEVDTVSGMAWSESSKEKIQVDCDTARVSWWCVPRLLFRHGYTLLAGTEILKTLMEDSLHGISCFPQSYLAPFCKYSCLKICKIPCLFPILSCRLQLQLMMKPAALLFRLTPWDEGKNCEMLWYMEQTKWILLNRLTNYKDVFWQCEFKQDKKYHWQPVVRFRLF